MRRSLFALAAFSLIASCKLQKLASVVSFEGEIDMSATTTMGGAAALTTTIKIKGAKTRTETPGFAGLTSISDAEAKKMWTINDGTHTYTETDLSAGAKSPATKSTMKAVKTGRSDKVAGYSCDVYDLVDSSAPPSSSYPLELCMASGLSMMALGLSGPFAAFAQGNDAWSEIMSHGFPLRVTMRDLGGKPLMTMEATRIERKSEPDSAFQVPAGYTKTTSPI